MLPLSPASGERVGVRGSRNLACDAWSAPWGGPPCPPGATSRRAPNTVGYAAQIGPPDEPAPLPVFYVALDDGEHFRVQVDVSAREATFPADDDYFRVYTGAHLITDQGADKCDDVSVSQLGHLQQRLDYVYAAVEGTARAVEDGSGIGLQVEGIVLRADNTLLGELPGAPGWEDLPDVALADGVLPAF